MPQRSGFSLGPARRVALGITPAGWLTLQLLLVLPKLFSFQGQPGLGLLELFFRLISLAQCLVDSLLGRLDRGYCLFVGSKHGYQSSRFRRAPTWKSRSTPYASRQALEGLAHP